MLKKLLKYDLKWCFKPLTVFYILSIFFAIVTRIMKQFDNSLIFIVISKICSGILIAMIANIIINNFMRVWARTTRNMYKDESYLTHTIPVTRGQIFSSKILTAVITMIASWIVIITSIIIAYATKDFWQVLKTIIEQTAIYFNSSIFSFIAVVVIVLFFEILFMVMAGVLGIVIGHKYNNSKIVKSIIFGFVLYMIPSILTIGLIYIMGLFNSDIMQLFNSSTIISTEAIKIVLYGGIIMYIAYDIIYYFIGKEILNKGINIE